MKIVIALVCVAAGYGLFAFDWSGFAEWVSNMEPDDRNKYICITYFVVGFVFWASANVISPDGDDGEKCMLGLFWLPMSVVVPIFFGICYMDKSFKWLGRRIR